MIKSKLRTDDVKAAVHKAATSYDIVDTANAIRYRDAVNEVLIPDITKLMLAWMDLAERESDTLQIGRSHLQHGEPITFGFATAWEIDRLGGRMLAIKSSANKLVGKFSGAVGAYNAPSLFVIDPIAFEKKMLHKLDISPASISTQIVQPEFVDDLIHYCITGFGVVANWAHDMRNLMRPEIAEIQIPRGEDVSSSSTMPHKQNPSGLENIESLWKEDMPKIITMYMDQISENCRDLTNSASQRYTPEILDIFDYAVRRATRIAKKIKTNPENMIKNFELSKNTITAEPLQLSLASVGRHTAHKEVGVLADRAKVENKSVVKLAEEDMQLEPYMRKLSVERKEILMNPEKYTGKAKEKTLEIVEKWKNMLNEINTQLSS